MFGGGDRVLRRGAERWERSARERRSASSEGPAEKTPEPADAGGRHRAEPGQQAPWRQRSRAPGRGGPDQFYVLATFVVIVLLMGGGTATLEGESLGEKLGGVLAVLCGAALTWVAVLHLRRPVKR